MMLMIIMTTMYKSIVINRLLLKIIRFDYNTELALITPIDRHVNICHICNITGHLFTWNIWSIAFVCAISIATPGFIGTGGSFERHQRWSASTLFPIVTGDAEAYFLVILITLNWYNESFFMICYLLISFMHFNSFISMFINILLIDILFIIIMLIY